MTRSIKICTLVLALLAMGLASVPAWATVTIVIVNVDGPGEGFNDPTPTAPVGGNPGTTLGQQRLNAFQYAANIWGAQLDSPVPVYIQAAFNPLTCTATSAVLGSAGAIQIFANFPGTELPNTWYHVALANKLAGVDLAPGPNGTSADDLVAQFNSSLDNPVCLGATGWYYGLDNNHGTNIDLVTVLLHEFGHGLGFANFVNEVNGTSPLGLGDVFSQYTLDVATGKNWNQMTTAERVTSAVNTNKVVWNGINVAAAVPSTLAPGTPLLKVNSPASLGSFRVGTAAFGPLLSSPGVTADMVVALDPADGAGPSTTDGCSPLTNAGAVAGMIAVIDRGTCGFVVKVKNAQNAGAVGVVIADNVAGSPPAGLGGADPTIVIPSARVTLADGTAIKTALGSGTVNATLGVDLSVRAGAEPATGKALLYAPVPVALGSSISHWDTIAFPNTLMEPAINGDLTHGLDLTLPEMADIGWFSDGDGVPDGADQCLGSDPSATVVIDGCDSGVPNTVFATGCRISDAISACADGAVSHGDFVSCVTGYTNTLKWDGVISGGQKGKIQSCAARASLP
jgi:hypothetical protein